MKGRMLNANIIRVVRKKMGWLYQYQAMEASEQKYQRKHRKTHNDEETNTLRYNNIMCLCTCPSKCIKKLIELKRDKFKIIGRDFTSLPKTGKHQEYIRLEQYPQSTLNTPTNSRIHIIFKHSGNILQVTIFWTLKYTLTDLKSQKQKQNKPE